MMKRTPPLVRALDPPLYSKKAVMNHTYHVLYSGLQPHPIGSVLWPVSMYTHKPMGYLFTSQLAGFPLQSFLKAKASV